MLTSKRESYLSAGRQSLDGLLSASIRTTLCLFFLETGIRLRVVNNLYPDDDLSWDPGEIKIKESQCGADVVELRHNRVRKVKVVSLSSSVIFDCPSLTQFRHHDTTKPSSYQPSTSAEFKSDLHNITTTMTRALSFFSAALLLVGTQAFVPASRPTAFVAAEKASTMQLSMGLFDFFSEDARKEREERRQREIEEQERLQAEILERRADPEKMAAYEARVEMRRSAIMAGQDPSSVKVMVEDGEE